MSGAWGKGNSVKRLLSYISEGEIIAKTNDVERRTRKRETEK
jgi:hypothetical protein